MMEPSLHFHHRERRFLLWDPQVEDRLLDRLGKGHAYGVQTVYLDTPERTWSALPVGLVYPKIRFRVYGSGDSFLEKKLRKASGEVIKDRIALREVPRGLEQLAVVSYDRCEYDLDGNRITVDHHLTGEGGSLGIAIVEVKGELPDTLRFLRKHEDRHFSKWKWTNGLLKSRIFAGEQSLGVVDMARILGTA